MSSVSICWDDDNHDNDGRGEKVMSVKHSVYHNETAFSSLLEASTTMKS
jgi:hypothetical protein